MTAQRQLIDDTKTRSMRVEVLIDTCVGSETTWVRLKDDTTDKSLKYREVEELKKSILKLPTSKKSGKLEI